MNLTTCRPGCVTKQLAKHTSQSEVLSTLILMLFCHKFHSDLWVCYDAVVKRKNQRIFGSNEVVI